MSLETMVWLAVGGAVVVVVGLFVRSGRRDLLPYVAAYVAFFGLGPAINHVLGNPVYAGIRTESIGQASLGLLLATAAMFAVGVLVPFRAPPPPSGEPRRRHPAVTLLLWASTAYAVAVMATAGTALATGSKLDRISVAGPWHYPYLLTEMFMCSLYFIASRTRAGRQAYWVNLVVYIGYCLVTNERDFAFVLLALLLHIQILGRRSMSVRTGLAGVGLASIATGLAILRADGGDATSSGLAGLNQGSVMFVDTFVMNLAPQWIPFRYGETYIDALLGLLPSWYAITEPTLMAWLVDMYAPGSRSGYGFSLSAEAYLNFGLLGIPVVYALLTLVHRYLVNRVGRSDLYPYLSMLFTIAWMYAVRGESATLLRTMLYGLLVFVGIYLTSLPARSGPAGHRRRRPLGFAPRRDPYRTDRG